MQVLGDRAQQHVAFQMAVRIVVSLEMIDVDHQHRQGPTLVEAAIPLALQSIFQRAAIGHAGQRVFGGQFGELAVDRFELVGAFADARLELAVGLDVALGASAHEFLDQQDDHAQQQQPDPANAPRFVSYQRGKTR